MLSHTCVADITKRFITNMPQLPKKGRYAKSAMSLVAKDVSDGMLKAMIIREEEIERDFMSSTAPR